jgi:hypothetical protein
VKNWYVADIEGKGELAIFQDIGDKRHMIADVVDWSEDTEEHAMLLAASPLMLETLLKIVRITKETGVKKADQLDYIETLAKAAIAKARP